MKAFYILSELITLKAPIELLSTSFFLKITNMTVLPVATVIDKILNLISTIANLLILLISLSLLCIIIYKLIHFNTFHRKQILKETSILLSINTLCLIILRSIFQYIDIDLNTFD